MLFSWFLKSSDQKRGPGYFLAKNFPHISAKFLLKLCLFGKIYLQSLQILRKRREIFTVISHVLCITEIFQISLVKKIIKIQLFLLFPNLDLIEPTEKWLMILI